MMLRQQSVTRHARQALHKGLFLLGALVCGGVWTAQTSNARVTSGPMPVAGGQALSAPVPAASTGEQGGERMRFASVTLTGRDGAVVEALPAWSEIRAELTAPAGITSASLELARKKIEYGLQIVRGYAFASVVVTPQAGTLEVKADCGRLRNVTVTGNKHYSTRQIEQKARQGQDASGRFNYGQFYNAVYGLNALADLKTDEALAAATDEAGGRTVDLRLSVHDSLPIHGAFEAANTGAGKTSDWRFRTTVEHRNLTRHDDTLAVSWLASPDFSEANAGAAQYFLPIDDKWTLSVFGGHADSSAADVLPMLNLNGKGSFAGLRLERTVFENDMHRVQVGIGWLYEDMQSQPGLSAFPLPASDTVASMPTLSLSYTAKKLDALNGRTFAGATVMGNRAGAMGSSSERSFNSHGTTNGEGDFVVGQFQGARLQRLFAGDEEPGKWLLFVRAAGQLASDPLVGTLRQPIGGMYTVRGYPEQSAAGDDTFIISAELRTPLLMNYIPGLKQDQEFLDKNPDYWGRHKLEGFVFVDFGHAELQQPLAGENGSENMVSVGPGVAMQLTKYSLCKVAWGIPLCDTEDSSNGGVVHVSLQVQF